MPKTDQIFTPKDNSLFERIRAYRSVAQAYHNAEASLKYMSNADWSNTLGEKQEVEQAYNITLNSLNTATRQISLNEINKANEQGLLNAQEVKEFIQSTRLHEINKIRCNRKKSNLSKDRQR